jgi:glycogen debranching enzyme
MADRTVAAGWTFLATDAAGRCAGEDHGLYHRDTRLFDRHELALGDRRAEPVGRLAPRPGERVLVDDVSGDPPATLRRTRVVTGEATGALPGLYERVEVRNGGASTLAAALRLAVGTRFDDALEVHGDADERTRSVAVAPGDGVAFSYAPDEGGGGQLVGVALDADAQVDVHGGFGRADAVLGTDLRVDPGASVTVHAAAVAGDPVGDAAGAFAHARRAVRDRTREWWDGLAPVGAAAADDRAAVVRRSVQDLLALAADTRHGPVFVAGVPRYGAPLGADAALSAYMALPLSARPAAATLRLLAAHRATGEAGVRAGRMPGVLRHGERAPGRFDGGVAATPLWVTLLHETWRRTGDDGLVADLWPALEGALDWLRRDGEGFLTCPTSAVRRDGAPVRPDGTPVEGTVAPAALQGYAHDALRRAAALVDGLRGDPGRARALRRQAGVFAEAFDAAFWLPAAGTYAAAVDGHGDPVRSAAAGTAHCLWSGVVPDDRSGAVVDRLLGPDCFSGWGPRTLAADHAGYDPDAHHRGGVRPHDAGIAALGAARYGHHDAAARLTGGLFDAAATLDGGLPEWFGGHPRGERDAVAVRAGACAPFAPAAAAPLSCLRATEGLGLPLAFS